MVKVIKTEFKKLQGSSMLWIGLGSCFILPVMALAINLSGVIIGIPVTVTEFWSQLKVYALAGFLMFICILPMLLASIFVKKGFLLSICISIVSVIGIFYIFHKQEA